MNKPAAIEKINHAIALELQAVIQYNQYGNALMGVDRRIWRSLFKEMSEGALEHARKFGFRVVALGGTPTIEHSPVKQASKIDEMLNNALELERNLVQAYIDALHECEDHPGYRNLLEDQIDHEQQEVEELEMFLNKVQKAAEAKPGSKRMNKAG